MIVIDRNTMRILELAWSVAFRTELGHERAAIIIATREYLHLVVIGIDDEQETSMMVERQASMAGERVIVIIVIIVVVGILVALLLDVNRELDSRVIIKRVISNLHTYSLVPQHGALR